MQVTLIAENAWPVICPGAAGAFGGMESQAWAFARALQQHGRHQVGFVVSSPAAKRNQTICGVRVCNRPARLEHLRKFVSDHCRIRHAWPPISLRRWHPRLLWALPYLAVTRPFRSAVSEAGRFRAFWRQVPGDIFIVYGASERTTNIVEALRAGDRRVIVSCASNDDLRAEYQTGSDYVNAYGDRADRIATGLNAADAVLVQTDYQRDLARSRLGLNATVVPNPIDPEWTEWAEHSDTLLTPAARELLPRVPGFVLWTGRTDDFHKRPDLALQIARLLPDIPLVMVLDVTSPEMHRRLQNSAPGNVHFLEPQPHPGFLALMRHAAGFLSTGSSEYEGFPNVFLQAGSLGVPIASLEADFGIISETGIGRSFQGHISELATWLRQQVSATPMHEPRWKSVTAVALRQQYSPASIADILTAVIDAVLLRRD